MFADYLREAIESQGLSLREVARRAGVSVTHVSRLIHDRHGRIRPTMQMLDALAAALGKPFTLFFTAAERFLPERERFPFHHPNPSEFLKSYLFLVYEPLTKRNLLALADEIKHLLPVLREILPTEKVGTIAD